MVRGPHRLPIVDAGMRQLNQTGYMHNRLRMITASFLTKDLGIDWRRGERYFAQQLNDYDLAANNGGCSGRFHRLRRAAVLPHLQSGDAVGEVRCPRQFIRRYVPEVANLNDKEIHAPWVVPADRQLAARCVVGRTIRRRCRPRAGAAENTAALLRAKER